MTAVFLRKDAFLGILDEWTVVPTQSAAVIDRRYRKDLSSLVVRAFSPPAKELE